MDEGVDVRAMDDGVDMQWNEAISHHISLSTPPYNLLHACMLCDQHQVVRRVAVASICPSAPLLSLPDQPCGRFPMVLLLEILRNMSLAKRSHDQAVRICGRLGPKRK
jgi:hypothetical protein